MISFEKNKDLLRKEKRLSKADPAPHLKTSISIWSTFQRNEITQGIGSAKKTSELFLSAIHFLLAENEDSTIFTEAEIRDQFKTTPTFNKGDRGNTYFIIASIKKEIINQKRYFKN